MTETAEVVELVELDRGECRHLLTRGVVGRVVFTDAAMPAAEPVNYIVDGEEVIFRSAGGSKLAAATRRAVVAFQVDEIDPSTHTGWSVLGVGEAYEVTDADRLAELAERLPAPWAPGHIAHTIAVPLLRLTGRRLSPRDAKSG
ncbi:pyridoxamine 5'-phosphate oxidase family protein [Pseudonocardia acidicola]|uniref:Pyridoxamine 5'-phosphate oxidase family protein n=1 Tax=Pseudonocardia acidicola TaxID=2724939 RepID=A0ABX1S7N6_9PSEU|nr:pyridoxamine 5'-phosphate oxidase family protein [Pseudonocardia acidicola]NMH97566.1 pyridoxamine 5'-phosphate oxidase family protein [Pseudonocardia acidicola]